MHGGGSNICRRAAVQAKAASRAARAGRQASSKQAGRRTCASHSRRLPSSLPLTMRLPGAQAMHSARRGWTSVCSRPAGGSRAEQSGAGQTGGHAQVVSMAAWPRQQASIGSMQYIAPQPGRQAGGQASSRSRQPAGQRAQAGPTCFSRHAVQRQAAAGQQRVAGAAVLLRECHSLCLCLKLRGVGAAPLH